MKSTYLNPWSWNNEVNILVVDQPVQVGFSYDVLTNTTAILDRESNGFVYVPTDFSEGVPRSNSTHYYGTFSSQKVNQTANSVRIECVCMSANFP